MPDKSLTVYQIVYEEQEDSEFVTQDVEEALFSQEQDNYSCVFVAAPDVSTAVRKVLNEEKDIPEAFHVEPLEGAFYVTDGSDTIEMTQGPVLDRHEEFQDKLEQEEDGEGEDDYNFNA